MSQTLSERPLSPADSPLASALHSSKVGFSRLRCRECGAEYEPVAKHVCDLCFGPLEVAMTTTGSRAFSRQSIQAGPLSIWRYRPFLPVLRSGPSMWAPA